MTRIYSTLFVTAFLLVMHADAPDQDADGATVPLMHSQNISIGIDCAGVSITNDHAPFIAASL